ncbi:hypothetical protein NLJ89_g11526 [Agrocybe chaxingu]|uniref:Uncharacterized protein n=1 Tax=Agrocybe chaxingu TaxID=84603 RepID=A0A9W8JP79_9AGAR|nr:hypothetical protein NLJ89_g11526 [Agrocybe chaxingu]
MCGPLSQMHALELDNWFNKAISSCEAGDAPETDLIVLPSVPPTSPLRSSCADFGLKSITMDPTVLSGWHQPLQTSTVDEPVSISSPRNPYLVPTMVEAQPATSALVAVDPPKPSTRTLTISQHIRGIFNCVCVLFVLFLIVLYTYKACAYCMCKVSLSFVRRENKIVAVALPSASVCANEVSEGGDDFFFPTPNLVDDTSIEEVQASPEDVVAEGVEEAALSDSEEVRCDTIQEELNGNVPLDDPISSVGVRVILDETPCSSDLLNPDADRFVPGALELPSASTSTALETVDDDPPPSPASIPTHISARPPGRRRRKHHRKNKNKVVEINLQHHWTATTAPNLSARPRSPALLSSSNSALQPAAHFLQEHQRADELVCALHRRDQGRVSPDEVGILP